MEKSDVYNMRAVPLMRKINIVKDGKTKSIVESHCLHTICTSGKLEICLVNLEC